METKNCYDCKHYLAHYIKRIDRMKKTDCGHCRKTTDKKNLRLGANGCKFFELLDINIENQQQKESIEKTVTNISKQLKILLEILRASNMNG